MGISKCDGRLRLRSQLFVLSPFWLASIHAILQVLDWATTLFLIFHLGSQVEANPIMRSVLEHPNGVELFTIIKLGGAAMIAWMIPRSIAASPRWAVLWRLLTIAYLGVVLSNLAGVATVYIMS
jgi:hypothetical protein